VNLKKMEIKKKNFVNFTEKRLNGKKKWEIIMETLGFD
jgi:hypothetical protein